MTLGVVLRSKSRDLLSLLSVRPVGEERVLGGECNRASGGLMASRCKCSQSGTQATYPPTDALCQLTPYSLIILFSFPFSLSLFLFISLSLFFRPSVSFITHTHILSLSRARVKLNYFINPLFPGSFSQPFQSLKGLKRPIGPVAILQFVKHRCR